MRSFLKELILKTFSYLWSTRMTFYPFEENEMWSRIANLRSSPRSYEDRHNNTTGKLNGRDANSPPRLSAPNRFRLVV